MTRHEIERQLDQKMGQVDHLLRFPRMIGEYPDAAVQRRVESALALLTECRELRDLLRVSPAAPSESQYSESD